MTDIFACTDDDMAKLSLWGLDIECDVCTKPAVVQIWGVCLCRSCWEAHQEPEPEPLEFDEELAAAVEGRDYID